MPDLVLDLLKYVFLAVLYIFIARAVRAIFLELRPATASAGRRASTPPPQAQARGKKKDFRKAAIIEGDKKGRSIDLADELIIGRAEKCHLVLDDSYVSQMHARIFSKEGGFRVEDLGSTNGTYLNRRRITSPTQLQRGDQLKIGKTVLEMRK
ncbi:MAG TPA: FHA domain-containing protein [Actinomycetota bacterium]|nr:FHA domain-containing protein [Actinomycetota bacterium]